MLLSRTGLAKSACVNRQQPFVVRALARADRPRATSRTTNTCCRGIAHADLVSVAAYLLLGHFLGLVHFQNPSDIPERDVAVDTAGRRRFSVGAKRDDLEAERAFFHGRLDFA